MSTISVQSVARQSGPIFRQYACMDCKAPYYVADGEHDPEYCPACRRGYAAFEARKLLGAVGELIRGEGVFSILDQRERTEQLHQLGLDLAAKPDKCCPEAPQYASEVARDLANKAPKLVSGPNAAFETPTAADMEAMLDTEEMEPVDPYFRAMDYLVGI